MRKDWFWLGGESLSSSSSRLDLTHLNRSLLLPFLPTSLSGILSIHDPLSLPPTHLRSFSERAASRHLVRHVAEGTLDPDLWRVSQIVLDRDLVVASVGSKILSWRIGKVGGRDVGNSPWSGKVIGNGRKRPGGGLGGGAGGGGVGKGRGGNSEFSSFRFCCSARGRSGGLQRGEERV